MEDSLFADPEDNDVIASDPGDMAVEPEDE
jgi:hypothetical protein